MRKTMILAAFAILAAACNTKQIEKPDNLIDKDKMVNILYDVSLLEAAKSQAISGALGTKEAYRYIFDKYKIDSLQFVKSNKYYASDIEGYKKMFEEIKNKMATEKDRLEADMRAKGQPVEASPTPPAPPAADTPQVK